MKKMAILAGILALGLGACTPGGGGNIGQGFGMDANVSGGTISVALVQVVDKTTGVTTGYRSTYLLQQPTTTFNARPQSIGFQVQNYAVEVFDNAGVRYGDDQGKYQRSASLIVQPGFTCGQTPAVTLDNCAPSFKNAANVVTSVPSLALVTDEIARRVTDDCQLGTCPTLKIRVSFAGVDDAGRPQILPIAGADLAVRVTSSSVVKE